MGAHQEEWKIRYLRSLAQTQRIIRTPDNLSAVRPQMIFLNFPFREFNFLGLMNLDFSVFLQELNSGSK